MKNITCHQHKVVMTVGPRDMSSSEGDETGNAWRGKIKENSEHSVEFFIIILYYHIVFRKSINKELKGNGITVP
jgi:hypothetical protein